MTNAESSSRQPDYYIGPSGIPRIVGGSWRSGTDVDHQRRQRQIMNQCGSASGGSISVGTDPVKLNKCLYNLTVRNRNGSSKTESDMAIRSHPCSHKSKSSASGSDSDNNTNNSNSRGASSWSSSTVITTGLSNNRRNPVTSSTSRAGSSSIPRSTTTQWTHHHLGRSANQSGTVVGRSLLSDRQRRNAVTGVSDSNRLERGECGSSLMVRQCRLTVAVRRPPPTTSASADNRLNYQRKYDRSIFGYNRLDQIVLPPLQI